MKTKALFLLLLLSLAAPSWMFVYLEYKRQSEPKLDRFTVQTVGKVGVLLDTETGKTWRNVDCPTPSDYETGFKSGFNPSAPIPKQKSSYIPNCWDAMGYSGAAPDQKVEDLQADYAKGFNDGSNAAQMNQGQQK